MEIAILIGAIVISVLAFIWLINVVKATIKTALLVAVILLILQIAFGIGPATLWDEGLQQVWQVIQDWAPIQVIREMLSVE
ncbi:MAG: hypothetical protein MJA27_22230 [Pseudanabaenales cyanobacterium]|nr:hypothetical protein [Pseudanabaenales cyanobacterium]